MRPITAGVETVAHIVAQRPGPISPAVEKTDKDENRKSDETRGKMAKRRLTTWIPKFLREMPSGTRGWTNSWGCSGPGPSRRIS